jgi:hypothetical protein
MCDTGDGRVLYASCGCCLRWSSLDLHTDRTLVEAPSRSGQARVKAFEVELQARPSATLNTGVRGLGLEATKGFRLPATTRNSRCYNVREGEEESTKGVVTRALL